MYTLIEANKTQPGSNKRMFSIGELLEFDTEDIVLPTVTQIPKQIDLQHNTNLIDLKDAGLSQDDIDILMLASVSRKKELEDEVALLQSQINDGQVAIIENQKRLNEIRKIISAVKEINNNEMLSKLLARENDLLIERDSLIENVNNLNGLARAAVDALIKVSELVK
jgi:hypothetical protein